MGFLRFIGSDRRDNRVALALFAGLILFYGGMNAPFLFYIRDHAAELATFNPFYGAAFPLNLFNFDPSIYYGAGNASVIHPFLNFVSGPLAYAARSLGGNGFFLAIQSIINAAGAAMIYYYLRRTGAERVLALGVAGWFGAGSYQLFTAMIPDSYPYAQFVILVSVLYLLYLRGKKGSGEEAGAGRGGEAGASFLLANFAVTSTNMIPYAAAYLVNGLPWRSRRFWLRMGLPFVKSAAMVLAVTGLQSLLFGGTTWFGSWMQSLENGGFRYAAPFVWSEHWKAIYMLAVSPVLTPDLAMVDPGIVAFATDLTRPYPLHVTVIGFVLIALAVLGFVRGIRTREAWVLASYIGFAAALHIGKGYGLAVFQYDLYLYAGHYLFAIFLLAASFIRETAQVRLRRIMTGAVLVFLLVTAVHNAVQHSEALSTVERSYTELSAGK